MMSCSIFLFDCIKIHSSCITMISKHHDNFDKICHFVYGYWNAIHIFSLNDEITALMKEMHATFRYM
jgi:hypothetical protein